MSWECDGSNSCVHDCDARLQLSLPRIAGNFQLPFTILPLGEPAMFGFGKKKVPPPLCPSNPGIGIEAKLAFANGGGSWTEEVNLVHIAADILRNHSYRTIDEKTHLRHPDSGFAILPQLVGVQPLEKGGVRTVTTMQVHHPTLAPQGVFEYQHAAGDTVRDSVGKGIDQWVQTDFVTLLESLLPKPKSCTALVMSFPANGDK